MQTRYTTDVGQDRPITLLQSAAMNDDGRTTILREKRCAACGERFVCCAGGCWCDVVSLTADTGARLAAQYSDCLCPTCLRRHAENDAGDCAIDSRPGVKQ